MHVHFLDPYRPHPSPVHALDARVKLVLVVAFILACAFTPVGAWPVYILLLALILAVVILSELGVVYVLMRSALALPFMLAALPLLFTVQGHTLWSFTSGIVHLSVSQEGLVRFLSIAINSWLSGVAAIVLASSTTFPDLLAAMRALHIPRLLVGIFGLMWRYLFVLVDEVLRLQRARAARSGELNQPGLKPGGSLAWRARVTGGMAGNLFLRGLERSDRIYLAMVSRGYDGEVRSFASAPLRWLDWLVLCAGVGLLAGLIAVGFLILG
ncbi:MAG: cobalt ECF transporter T component CbiQ [Anaerolineales bacterium]|jgi:cobalt/nickel transport system permease protein|nr:cobalt ECF transporter T component CbiQ [Anaerolineales bacterium]